MYTTEQKIEQLLQINIDDTISGSVIDWIKWVSKYIDNYTKTTFISSNQVYYYDILKTMQRIFIDDCISISSAELLDLEGNVTDTLTENDDYWLYPLNKITKNELRLNPYGKYSSFPFKGSKKLKLTGSFGVESTVPADIEMVATQMVGDIIKQVCGAARGVKEEKLGDRSIAYDEVGQFAIPYQKVLDLYRCPTL